MERVDLTNAELLGAFKEAMRGDLAEKTIEQYHNFARDAIHYFRTPTGKEIPVRKWTKQGMRKYVSHITNNYCANLRAVPKPGRVRCEVEVWQGARDATEAVKTCETCPLFKKLDAYHRLNGISRFFAYLAELDVVPYNFARDVLSEYNKKRPEEPRGERKRNPTVEEEVRLVNGTAHPKRRFIYAATAKWGVRANELLMLDRYASLGLPMPPGVPEPRGFERGFNTNPQLRNYAQGGRCVWIPETKGKTDKRTGNRWLIVDDELRPITDAYLEWWERTVRRDGQGRPFTTDLIINNDGTPFSKKKAVDKLNQMFFEDCERLGLMLPGDRKKALRKWTSHCQRHHLEQRGEELEVPSDWLNHFRGDAFTDARGSYYEPRPEAVERKYLRHLPPVGFLPIPNVAGAMRGQEARA